MSPIVPLYKIFEEDLRLSSLPIDMVRCDILKQVTIAGEYFPKLKEAVANKGKSAILLSTDEISDFIF